MPEVNVRKYVIDQLKPLLPKAWRWYAYGTNLDTLSVPVVMLALQSISRDPSAPQGNRVVSFTLTVIEPRVDPETREDALDESLIELLNAIDDVPAISWTIAERGLADGGNHLGFDITLQISITKEDS